MYDKHLQAYLDGFMDGEDYNEEYGSDDGGFDIFQDPDELTGTENSGDYTHPAVFPMLEIVVGGEEEEDDNISLVSEVTALVSRNSTSSLSSIGVRLTK